MGTIVTARSKTIIARDNFGRFADACDRAAIETVNETVKEGARVARAMAPAGKNRHRYAARPGYVPLKRSIRHRAMGTRGYWYSVAPHALHVEFGTSAHLIYGKLRFFWKGGYFFWNNPAYPGNQDEGGAWVRHPGTSAQPYLRPSYEAVARRRMMQIAKDKYPG